MQFATPDFQRALAMVLRAAERGAADSDDVLATAARIQDGDADSWVVEWLGTAGEAWAAARGADPLRHLLRAATYYDAALELIEQSADADRGIDIWRRQRACWDRAANILGGQRIRIAYEDTTLPGYFFAAAHEPRPLVIMHNGSVGATSRMWALGGAAAADRGWHWITFDGPGQQAALVEQGLLARPDWEAVLTPVVDAMLARGDVAPDRIAAIGVGQGGFWLPRALAHEHRLAAAVADPGIVDVSAPWVAALSRRLREQLRSGDREGFDRDMHVALLFAPAAEASLRRHAAPYGLNGSFAALYDALAAYRLTAEPASVTTPLLITEDDDRWPGQARELVERVAAPATLAPARREAVIFDWLASQLVTV
jgi:hypothetical protein